MRYSISFEVKQTNTGTVDVEVEAESAEMAKAIAKGRLIGAAAGGDDGLAEYDIDWHDTGIVHLNGTRRVIEVSDADA